VAKCLITEALEAGSTVDAPMQLEHAPPAKLTAEPKKGLRNSRSRSAGSIVERRARLRLPFRSVGHEHSSQDDCRITASSSSDNYGMEVSL
jgi:hypothetical protein